MQVDQLMKYKPDCFYSNKFSIARDCLRNSLDQKLSTSHDQIQQLDNEVGVQTPSQGD